MVNVEYLEVPKLSLKVIFFDNFPAAKAAKSQLTSLAASCDQLNIVIKAEGPQYDEELSTIGKLYVGEAWTLIHQRRQEEGWYTST